MPETAVIVDSAIDIVTPENIAFRYELAGPFRRVPAYLLDIAVRLFALGILGAVVSLAGIAVGGPVAGAIFILALFVMEWFYGGLFETYWNGQTPGKRSFGLRVLTIDGRPINGLQAVLRNVLRSVDMMPLLPLSLFFPDVPPVGVVPMFLVGLGVATLNRRFQRMGDLVCGTIVVEETRSWTFGVSKVEDARAAQLAEALPANFVVPRQMSRALATYMERRRFFSAARRREIAGHIARPLIEQFHLPTDTSYDLLMCALYYRTFIADRKDDDAPLLGVPAHPFTPLAAASTKRT